MNARALLKEVMPPVLARALRKPPVAGSPVHHFTGDFTSWAEAQGSCQGYDAHQILEKTREATLAVMRGEGAFERDSVVFPEPDYSFALLAGLSRAAAVDGGRLSVLDFGGALGSTYFQNRKFLAGIRALQWGVVEQPAHVACGRTEISGPELKFFLDPQDCISAQHPNVLLLSAVIQYLPDPYGTLADLCRLGIASVIIDRTAFIARERDRLTLQRVPESIYQGSYPAWFLNEHRLVELLASHGYAVLADFPSIDRHAIEGDRAYFKGFLCTRK